MRVADVVSNRIAQKSGIPTLMTANAMDQNAQKGTLLEALNKQELRSTYREHEKLRSEAEHFADQVRAFDAAEDSALTDAAEHMADGYNALLERLDESSSTLDHYYAKMFREAAAENRESLSAIGLTQDKQGRLVTDREKLRAADADDIRERTAALVQKFSFLAGRVAENAKANVQSLTGRYGANGSSLYDADRYHAYDFLS